MPQPFIELPLSEGEQSALRQEVEQYGA